MSRWQQFVNRNQEKLRYATEVVAVAALFTLAIGPLLVGVALLVVAVALGSQLVGKHES